MAFKMTAFRELGSSIAALFSGFHFPPFRWFAPFSGSVGDDYVDTKIFPDADTEMRIICRWPDASLTNINGTNDGTNRFYVGTYQDEWLLGYGDAFIKSGIPSDSNFHKFLIRNAKLYVDGDLAIDASSAVFSATSLREMVVGGQHKIDDSVASDNMEVISFYLKTGLGEEINLIPTDVNAMINVAPSPELLVNGGFEEGTGNVFTNWYQVYTEEELTSVHSGSRAMKMTQLDSPNWYDVQTYQSVVVTPGSEYVVDFWTRGDGSNGAVWALYDETNADYIYGGQGGTTGVTGTTYEKVRHMFKAPAGCVSVKVWFFVDKVAGAVAYFDDVSFVEVISGMELLSNGEFDTPVTEWAEGTGWAAGGGVATYNGLNGTQSIHQDFRFTIGVTYLIVIVVLSNEGTGTNVVDMGAGGGSLRVNGDHLLAGKHKFVWTAPSTASGLSIYGRDGEVFSLDSVSIVEVFPNQGTGDISRQRQEV